MTRCIVIDDERSHREYFKEIVLKHFSDLELVGEADSVAGGIELLNQTSFDILFLDVRMPPLTGFDVLKAVPKRDFEVVFTTSYGEYAIEAIKFSALDYLLKPFSVDDLKLSIDKFRALGINSSLEGKIENLLHNLNPLNSRKRIGLSDNTGIEFFDIDEIVYCQSENVYTTFYFERHKEIVTSKPIKEYERELSNFHFFRIHNSFLINLRKVQKYIRGEGGQVKMTNGVTLDVARYRKESFLKLINKI